MATKRQVTEKESERFSKNNKSTRNLSLNLSSGNQQKNTNTSKKPTNTRVIIKYDVGFKNSLFLFAEKVLTLAGKKAFL